MSKGIQSITVDYSGDERSLCFTGYNGSTVEITFEQWEDVATTADAVVSKALKLEYDEKSSIWRYVSGA